MVRIRPIPSGQLPGLAVCRAGAARQAWGALAPGRLPGSCSAAVWSSIQGSPCFQKLARDRERGVSPSSPSPRKGPRRAAALARAKGPPRAKRHCRRSSCRRPRPPPRWTDSRSRAWTARIFPGNPESAPALPRLGNRAKPLHLGLGPALGDEDGDEWPSTKGMGPCYVFPSLGAGSVARQGSAGAGGTVPLLLEPQRWHGKRDLCAGVPCTLTVILRVWRRMLNSLASS